jgi:imidazolonepropionase-like amidohydrolase
LRTGTPVVAGTDAGTGGTPHGSLAHELDEFVDAGMSRMQALVSGTLAGAQMLEVDDRKGSVSAGAAADLLVFARALDDADFSFHEPALVMRGGVVVKASPEFSGHPR